MSHYKPYPAYKDSEIGWLGHVPETWTVMSIKHIVSTPITDGPHETPDFVDEGIPFVSAEAISSGSIDFSKIRGFITESDHRRYSQKYHPKKGDVYMIKSGATTGVTAIVETDIEFNIWSPLAVIRCGHRAIPRYVLNFMRSRSFQEAVALNWSYGTQQNIGMGVIGDIAIPVPSISEQMEIITHLDRETTRIDALVSKKTRFIELLREKRQALITHAVTKGLDPNVKMKDSGVEWLGDVPEHWDSLTIRRVAIAVKTGGTPSSEPPGPAIENGIAWYTPGDFGRGMILCSSEKQVAASMVSSGEAKIFPAESVLIVSIGATLGKVGYITAPASANQQINAVLPNKRINGYFLAYSLSVKTEAMWFLANAATIGIMNQEKTKDIWLAVPSIEEQLAISDYLDRETSRIDTVVTKTERSIELLKERRSALITAAVTGQIDLREAA